MICQMESCPRNAKTRKLDSTAAAAAKPESQSQSQLNTSSTITSTAERGTSVSVVDEPMEMDFRTETSSQAKLSSSSASSVKSDQIENTANENSEHGPSSTDFEVKLRQVLECQLRLFRERYGDGDIDSLYENAYLLLDPELQPISPATDIAESMKIYEEHKKLAQEYLKCRTEIECLLEVKESLEKQRLYEETGGPLHDTQRFFQELRELQSENVGLVQLHQNLKKQLEIMKKARNPAGNNPPDFEPEPGWVMVERK